MTTVTYALLTSWQKPWAHSRKFMYNQRMSLKKFPLRTDQLPRVATTLWVAYFAMLAFVDWWAVDRGTEVFLFYAIQIVNSLFIFGLTLLPWRRLRAERMMLPIVLMLMVVLPSATVHLMLRLAPSEPLQSPEGMTLRLTPILLMGLFLTAWQYRWRYVVLFCLGTAALNLIGIWGPLLMKLLSPLPPAASRLPPPRGTEAYVVTFIQTISFLGIGYFTSSLNGRLREQRNSLEEANVQLRHQAATQDELTISHERNRMARELHDTLAHTLSGLTVQLQTIKAYWEIEPATSQKMLDDALAATRDGLQETRNALKSLRAAPLEDLGLSLAIRQLAEGAATRASLELDLLIADPLPSLAPEVGHTLYRVAQEAIVNVVYHANARKITVQVTANDDNIQLVVADDGNGFDSNQTYHNHWGIKGMRERAQLVDGQLVIESPIGYGTTITLTVPWRVF